MCRLQLFNFFKSVNFCHFKVFFFGSNVLYMYLLKKGSVPLRRSENIGKIENEYFVHCLVSWFSLMFKLLSEKMLVFKIEYLSSYNRFFRVGVLCLH